MKVLVVDDTEATRKALIADLLAEGCQVDSAEDGQQGLEMIKRNRYDLVLTDMNMPRLGGLEMGEILAGHPPVLMYTLGNGVYGIEMLLKRYKIKGFIPNANLESIKDAVMNLFTARVNENSAIANQILNS